MEQKRPTTVTVLCILSWVWLAIILYNTALGYMQGPPTAEELKQAEVELIASQNGQNMEVAGPMIDGIMFFIEAFVAKFNLVHGIAFIQILIGLLATIFMFRMRKIGFHLYIIYSLIPILAPTFIYGATTLAIVFTVISLVMAGIFVTLYAVQSKHMQ